MARTIRIEISATSDAGTQRLSTEVIVADDTDAYGEGREAAIVLQHFAAGYDEGTALINEQEGT